MDIPGEKEFTELVKQYSHIGYGNMMSIISRMWREKNPAGALTVGPCYKQVEVYGEYFAVVEERDELRKELETLKRQT